MQCDCLLPLISQIAPLIYNCKNILPEKVNEPRCCTSAEGRWKSGKPRTELEASVPIYLFNISDFYSSLISCFCTSNVQLLIFRLTFVLYSPQDFKEWKTLHVIFFVFSNAKDENILLCQFEFRFKYPQKLGTKSSHT